MKASITFILLLCVLTDSFTLSSFKTKGSLKIWNKPFGGSPSSTAISMGLKGMLRFPRRDREDEEPEDDEKIPESKKKKPAMTEDEKQAFLERSIGNTSIQNIASDTPDEPFVSDQPVIDDTETQWKPLRMGIDPSTNEVNVHTLQGVETIQERINRVKSGKMTDEEKRAFLQTALSAGNTPESRPPLRMSKQTPEEVEARKRSTASPFPSDAILRNVARGNNTKARDYAVLERAGLDNQKKKKEYYEMVTNPERYNLFKSQRAPHDPHGVSRLSGLDDRKTPITDLAHLNDVPSISPPTRKPSPTVSYQASKPDANTRYSPSPSPIQQPQAWQQYKKPASQPTLEPAQVPMNDLGDRLGAAAMANEQAKKKAEEARKEREKQLEVERLERERRNQEMIKQRQEEQRKREAELFVMRRREEERLAREKDEQKRKERERMEEMMRAQEEYWQKRLAAERAAKMKSVEKNVDEELKEIIPLRQEDDDGVTESVQADSPTSKVEIEVPTQQVVNEPNGSVGAPEPLLDTQIRRTPSELRQDQKSKKQQQEDEYLLRLRSLNSPLPSPPKKRGAPPAPSTFQPQRPVSYPSSPASSRASLGTMLQNMNDKRDLPSSKPETDSPASAPNQEYQTPPWKIWGDIDENKKIEKESPKLEDPSTRTGPIRMQLPMDDDDDDSVDTRANPSLSIKDVMKRTNGDASVDQEGRSKKWGVDINKFM